LQLAYKLRHLWNEAPSVAEGRFYQYFQNARIRE
jgi:hypothetical protein